MVAHTGWLPCPACQEKPPAGMLRQSVTGAPHHSSQLMAVASSTAPMCIWRPTHTLAMWGTKDLSALAYCTAHPGSSPNRCELHSLSSETMCRALPVAERHTRVVWVQVRSKGETCQSHRRRAAPSTCSRWPASGQLQAGRTWVFISRSVTLDDGETGAAAAACGGLRNGRKAEVVCEVRCEHCKQRPCLQQHPPLVHQSRESHAVAWGALWNGRKAEVVCKVLWELYWKGPCLQQHPPSMRHTFQLCLVNLQSPCLQWQQPVV